MNVIRYTLPKLWKLGILTRDVRTHLYTLSNPEYRDQAIVEAERIARDRYGELVGQLTSTCSDLGVRMSGDEVLEGWLDRSSLSFLGGSAAAYHPPSPVDRTINRVIATALTSYAYSPELLSSLTEIALGDALYRAVQSLTEFDAEEIDSIDITQRMNRVSCYFDTVLLLKVLGYFDPDQTSSAQEMLSMCKAIGCSLFVFSHTIEEMQRIFRAVASNINYSQQRSPAIRGDIASYALEHGLSANDLIELAASVPDDLAKLGFHIADSPTITIRES